MFKRFLSHPKVRSVFWAIISVLTMVSLIGYHAQDNSWNTSSNEVQNYLGPIGAWTADILLQVLGGMAFVFPIVCLIFAVFLWREVRWLKLRLFLIVLGFLWTTWLLGDYQYETVRSWFKAGLGGFAGHYLNRWWMIPKGYWMILWVALDMALFVWVLKIPFGKISRATGKSCWWLLHKTGIRLPAKISVLFKKLRIHHQVEKIKKSAPKSKIKIDSCMLDNFGAKLRILSLVWRNFIKLAIKIIYMATTKKGKKKTAPKKASKPKKSNKKNKSGNIFAKILLFVIIVAAIAYIVSLFSDNIKARFSQVKDNKELVVKNTDDNEEKDASATTTPVKKHDNPKQEEEVKKPEVKKEETKKETPKVEQTEPAKKKQTEVIDLKKEFKDMLNLIYNFQIVEWFFVFIPTQSQTKNIIINIIYSCYS